MMLFILKSFGAACLVTLAVISIMVGPLMIGEAIWSGGTDFHKHLKLFLDEGWVMVGMLYVIALLGVLDQMEYNRAG